jgi:hypothetical protein
MADSIRLSEMIQSRLRGLREDVPTGRSCYASALRQELIARNSSYTSLNFLPHVTSYGELPVVVYQQSECGSASWEFHFSQLQSNSQKARVAKTIAEGTPRADVRCLLRTVCGASSILH